MSALRYLFEPLPLPVGYDNPKVQLLLALCVGFIILSFGLRVWRRRTSNSMTKKLSRSWPSAVLWFGIVGLVFLISRTEDISILSMRFLWILWLACFLFYAFVQYKLFRARHYETLPTQKTRDPRDAYLPKSGKRR